MAISSFSTSGGGGTSKSSPSSFATFGSSKADSFGSFGGAQDASSVEGLLALAQAKGGATAEAANSLVHPDTGILSTIGKSLKDSFKGFIDVLSLSSEVVAGAISAKYTIKEAIDLHIKPSDVIFGNAGANMSTMQKVGNFSVRLATDVLLDPLTYLTFGAGSATVLGVRGASAITLGAKTRVLTKAGMAELNYLKKVARQSTGFQSALSLGGDAATQLPARLKTFKEIKALEASGKISPEVMSMGKEELARLLKETVDSPLNPDFAKLAMGKVLKKFPQLTSTLIDKGGIKFFGKSILSGQRIGAVAELIPGMTWLDRATEQSRLAVGSLFDPSVKGFRQANGQTQFTRIPPEFMEFNRKAEDMVGYLKDERIKNMQDIMKANGIDPNTSGQFFMASVENGKIPADPILARAFKQLLGYNGQELKYLRGAGIPISALDNHAPHILVNSGIKTIPFKLPPSVKVGANLQRTMEGRIFKATPEQLSEWEKAVLTGNKKVIEETIQNTKQTGFEIFDDNFFTASIARSRDNARSGTMKQFIDALGGNFAKLASEAPEGWVGLDLKKFKNANELLAKRGMADSQMVFHPAIAAKIEDFTSTMYGDEGMHAALTAFDKLQNAWKASVTSIWPAFHGRNAISNVFLNFNDIGLESLNPQTHALSAQFLKADFELNGLAVDALKGGKAGAKAKDAVYDMMTKKAFTDASGYEWSMGELRSVMKRNNIAMRDNLIGQVDTARSTEDMINAIMPKGFVEGGYKDWFNPFGENFKPWRGGRWVGNQIEGQARMVNFLTNLRKTGDVDLAVARTKQFLFDYQYLTPFEKNVMRRIVPFYTFTRKNLEAQVSTLMTAPGRTAAQVTAVTTLGDAIAGDDLTKEEKAALPDWMQSGLNIVTKKDGKKIEIIQSIGTPIEAVFSTLAPRGIMTSLSPFMRIPAELATGYDTFQGKPLSEVTNAASLKSAPGFIKDFIGYTDVSFKNKEGENVSYSVALRPDRLHLILNLPITSRVLSTVKQMQAVDVSEQNRLGQLLVGIRPFSFDIELEASKRENEMKKKLEQILSSAGVGYTLERFIPKESE